VRPGAGKENINLKILVVCHKDCHVPLNGAVCSAQAGAAKGHIAGMTFYDDCGDNISDKNGRYGELTVQYWAWKNLKADYFGFFHYRRYLSFQITNDKRQGTNKEIIKVPCFCRNFTNDFGLDESSLNDFIAGCDAVVPMPLPVKSVYAQYKRSFGHSARDLDFCLRYIKNNYPGYTEAAAEYMRSKRSYLWNCFVMKEELFSDYCEWLFPILDAFDGQKNYDDCSPYERRAVGFLAERLFGVYLTHLKKQIPDLKIKETQAVFIQRTKDKGQGTNKDIIAGDGACARPPLRPRTIKRKKPLYAKAADRLFPRGTRRREFLKALFRRRRRK